MECVTSCNVFLFIYAEMMRKCIILQKKVNKVCLKVLFLVLFV